MFLKKGRIALKLKDRSVLYFDYRPEWGGFYVLDASASPTRVIEEGRAAAGFNNYRTVKDSDLVMFFSASDVRIELYEPLVLRVGVFKPDKRPYPYYSSGSTCTVSGGVIVP